MVPASAVGTSLSTGARFQSPVSMPFAASQAGRAGGSAAGRPGYPVGLFAEGSRPVMVPASAVWHFVVD
eukprot:11878075-Alexandrium_andersonii.AAC.1